MNLQHGKQLYPAGIRVWTPSHRVAKLVRWRENLLRWDARYADGKGEPVLLDPRHCTPV